MGGFDRERIRGKECAGHWMRAGARDRPRPRRRVRPRGGGCRRDRYRAWRDAERERGRARRDSSGLEGAREPGRGDPGLRTPRPHARGRREPRCRCRTPRRGAYTASKFGVIGLTQVLAQELAAHGITVNAICPGSVDTSRRESTSRRERALAEGNPGAPVLGLPPTGRVARPDDIARLALFFASE